MPRSALSTGPPTPGVRALFPALSTAEVYLDSAATTQRPLPVIETVTGHLRRATANAGRGSYPWSSRLATRIAEIRARTAQFVGAAAPEEIVFTPGATAALNAVALCWALPALRDGDHILLNPLDHASNVLPWHHLRTLLARAGHRIELVPYRTTPQGAADIDDIVASAGPRTRLVTLSHLHHVYGGLTDVAALRARLSPEVALCLDCSQSGGHLPVDVRALGVDFAVFAAHKMFGTPGTGVLYCAGRVHDRLLPFLPGGDTGVRLTGSGLESTGMPRLLEGGTPNIPGILALGSAIDVLEAIDRRVIAEHNRLLTRRIVDSLGTVPGIRFLPGAAYELPESGPATGRAPGYGIVSFTLDGIGSRDLGFVLAEHGFLVRTGAHCVPSRAPDDSDDSVRVSTHIYTTVEEIDRFTACIASIAEETT